MAIVLIVLIVLLLIVAFIWFKRSGGFSFPWIAFYVKGKEAGFKLSEIGLLRKAAVKVKLPEPTKMFWLDKSLRRCIRELILWQWDHNLAEEPTAIDFLSKLFEFRERIQMKLPRYTRGIASSREINVGQFLKIFLKGELSYSSKVVENLQRYIAISHPQGAALPPEFNWQKQDIRVQFQRPEDAGYYFNTEVLGDYKDKKILHIKHSYKLNRVQRRNSIRTEANQVAHFILLNSEADADERAQIGTSHRCKLMNISESGAQIVVGGRAKVGKVLKIQTELAGQDIILSGVIKNVIYLKAKNHSVLNIAALPPSGSMKNRILMHVHGIFLEDEAPSP